MTEFRKHPLAYLIPDSNTPRYQWHSTTDERSKSIENSYDHGFAGCFDGHGEQWSQRIVKYDDDRFRGETDGEHLFSEVVDSLDEPGGDICVYTHHAYEEYSRDAAHPGVDDLFGVRQNYGNCVDMSYVEMVTGLLGYRAATVPDEAMRYLVAGYLGAMRGYCGEGWTMSACATAAKNYGWCPATVIDIGNRVLDWQTEESHEVTTWRKWCNKGLPDALVDWTKGKGFRFKPNAITQFNTGIDSLKKLFAAGGQFHHGGSYTSASRKPNTWKKIGGHAQTAFGGDWSDATRRWFHDHGHRISDDDFWVLNHQTWSSNWSGSLSDDLWPYGVDKGGKVVSLASAMNMTSHERMTMLYMIWGPKPPGTWVCSAKELLRRVNGYAYLPLLGGVKRPVEKKWWDIL